MKTNLVLLLNQIPHWEPLKIGVVSEKAMFQLSPKLLNGLRVGILKMHYLINVWYSLENNKLNVESFANCTPHWHAILKKQFWIGTMNKWQKFDQFSATNQINLTFYNVNFLLFLQVSVSSVDIQRCENDDGLLGIASPCALIRDNPPTAGQLSLCAMNRRWTSFQAVEDFFRHEILHALGFGLINPKKRLTSSREFQWTDASGSQQVTAVYMDFQDNAVIAARNHFKCQNLRGVEADDEDRIHLNEYIYGNELMTPILSNGKNYFTKISASILEATRNGKKQWYKTNESLVLAETKAYWYGRKWGCVFAESSCYDYINSQINNG
ncbi:unnamed protein product [Thelazia callipaeda]|uniref:Leishmanolysin-like peptidase n=1 Tax=Thelazia callipaeda TaxID=103827 RepID=A0A0N5DC24_THECL|nr:unnamed protein product [Thelazia callipaeda]